jgi:signal-transduction protein with cAMP-binding, CBS, and nucleotidyltransferase domain
MDFNLVLQNVAKHIILNSDEVSYFTGLLRYKELKRKEFLLKEGTVARHINFIHAGALKAYYIDAKSDENIIMLAMDDWWITDMYSFASGNPAMQYISAIEDSVIFQLQKNDFDELLVKVPLFERFLEY